MQNISRIDNVDRYLSTVKPGLDSTYSISSTSDKSHRPSNQWTESSQNFLGNKVLSHKLLNDNSRNYSSSNMRTNTWSKSESEQQHGEKSEIKKVMMKKCRVQFRIGFVSPVVAVLAASCELIPAALVGLFIRSRVQWSARLHDIAAKRRRRPQAQATAAYCEWQSVYETNPCGKSSNEHQARPYPIFHVRTSHRK
ncbi:hypothetical protein CBL_01112 [Carabus blaptoides fortunei]